MSSVKPGTTIEVPPPRANSARAPAGRSLWKDAWLRLLRDKAAMICLGVILLYAFAAIGGAYYTYLAKNKPDWGWKTYQDMTRPDLKDKPPTLQHGFRYVLGADWAGRPVLVGVILGAEVSLTVGLMANLIAVPLGMLLGTMAGYHGKRVDSFIVWLYSTMASVPGIILLMAFKFAFQGREIWGLDLSGIHGLYIALGIISWVGTCRLVRAEVMKVRELDYVVAARAVGRRSMGILGRHIMPNIMHIAIINFSLGFVGAVQAEVFLSFLGLGVTDETSWGKMINGARTALFAGHWWESTFAVAAMFLLVLALNIFGDRLRDALDPRLKNA
jgi:peptide/nickel transport system permease protein